MFPDYHSLILYQLQHRPGCEIQDIYKLLFQSIRGPEHLLHNPDAARERLRIEWEQQQADSNEPSMEPISLDGRIVRANIRPLKAKGMDWLDLWEAFAKTAQTPIADKNAFIAAWQQTLIWLQDESLVCSANNILQFDENMRINDYPVMHHSPRYKQLNSPAYRVVWQPFLQMPE
jgi:hypothetical protein